MKEKILIIQTAFLGDAVLTLPMIQKLCEKFPSSAISVLCIPSTKEVFEHSPGVDTVIVYDKRKKDKAFSNFIEIVSEIRKTGYSRIYSPHRSLRSSLIVLFSGSRHTTGFDTSSAGFVYKTRVKYFPAKHEVARNLDLIGYDTSGDNWRILPLLSVDDPVKENIGRQIENPDKLKIAAVAPGSVWKTKVYPNEYYEEIIRELANQNYYVVLLGGGDDAKLCDELEGKFNRGVKSFAGKLSIVESVALLKNCSLLICNDSAPAHLGMIADIPVLTLYCSTIPEFGFYPYNRKSKSLSIDGLDCKPCGIHGRNECPVKSFDCGKKLLPETVLKEAFGILSAEEK